MLSGLAAHPLGDALARPLVVVVEMDHQRGDRQVLVARTGTTARRVLEEVEQAPHPRVESAHVTRQQENAFVGGAERVRSAVLAKVFAEGLHRPATDARHDRLRQIVGFLTVRAAAAMWHLDVFHHRNPRPPK